MNKSLALLSSLLLLSGCTKVDFKSAQIEVLGKSVFAGDVADGVVDESGTTQQLPVENMCSNALTNCAGTNVLKSTALEIQVLDPQTNQVVCATSEGVRDLIVNEGKLIIPVCAEMTANRYHLRLIASNSNNANLLAADRNNLVIQRSSAASPFAFEERTSVLYDANPNGRSGSGTDGEACDHYASPLIIDLRRNLDDPRGVDLSAPTEGILFDILGENSFPQAHAKKQISWVHNSDYRWLVLPNAQGAVNGINEMFGDNTRGPDGQFAANGFLALAKYDGRAASGQIDNADGVIDKKDLIFKDLRLWSDRNFNGVADKGELVRLSDAGVVSIDLGYDPSFSETDRFGNRTELKSLVHFDDGQMRLIFDLWFRYL